MVNDDYKPRTLVEICTKEGGEFYRILNGNVYCSLAGTKGPVDCPHCNKKIDKNDLYTCNYSLYNKIRDLILYGKTSGIH